LKEPFAEFIGKTLGDDVLLIACGLPGTWKTETTEEAAKIKGYPILRTDLIRKDVLKNEDIFDEKVASSMDKRTLVYDEMFRRADDSLNRGEGVILDATFVTQSLRILARTKDNYVSNALTEQAYLNNKKKFEEVDLDDLKEQYPGLAIIHLTVDTTHDDPPNWHIIGIVRK